MTPNRVHDRFVCGQIRLGIFAKGCDQLGPCSRFERHERLYPLYAMAETISASLLNERNEERFQVRRKVGDA